MDESIIRLVGLLISLALSAIFSAAEALLNRLNKDEIIEIVEEGGSRADVITSLLEQPRKYFTTIIVARGCLIVGVALLVSSLLADVHPVTVLGVAILLVVIFTEIVPKNYIKDKNRNSLVYATRFLQISYIVGYPLIKPMMLLGYLWTLIFGGKIENEESLISPEDIETLVNIGDSEELLEEDERDMISRIFALPDTVAREAMVPRTDMVCLDISSDMDEILKTAIETGHSRIPVYEGTIDNVIGILHVKEMFSYWRTGKQINLREIIENHPPFITPESKKINDLLQEFRDQKQRMAIVVDEYGGIAGLITIEDIIEEIVGEIQDENETDEGWFNIQYIINAKASVSEVNERLGINLPYLNAETIGKLIADFHGQGLKTHEDVKFSILETDGKDILSVGIVKNPKIASEIENEPIIEQWGRIQYLVDARMDIDEFNERLGTNLTSKSVDSIGGFIVDLLGEVPTQNKTFEYQGLQFSILEADGRRILRIGIVKNQRDFIPDRGE